MASSDDFQGLVLKGVTKLDHKELGRWGLWEGLPCQILCNTIVLDHEGLGFYMY